MWARKHEQCGTWFSEERHLIKKEAIIYATSWPFEHLVRRQDYRWIIVVQRNS
jgi:hypothetical protein